MHPGTTPEAAWWQPGLLASWHSCTGHLNVLLGVSGPKLRTELPGAMFFQRDTENCLGLTSAARPTLLTVECLLKTQQNPYFVDLPLC